MPPTQKMRIILKSFDHRVLDVSAQQILETAERTEPYLTMLLTRLIKKHL